MPVPMSAKPPAMIAPAPPVPSLKEIELVTQGKQYHVPITGVPCSSLAVTTTRIVQQPSLRMTLVVSCDGPNSILEVSDDPKLPAPVPSQTFSPEKKKR